MKINTEMNQGKHNEQSSELCLKIIILLNYNPFVKEMIFDSINVFNKKHGFQAWNRNVDDIYLFSNPRYYDLIYNCCLYFLYA